MTTITRLDLQNMYLEHIEAEKIRISKLLEEELNSILRDILNENKLGRKKYTKNYPEYQDEFINIIIYKLKEIFADSKVTFDPFETSSETKPVLLTVDWSI